ncbi:MAG: GntR family transcriptional regulator [Paeniclostridium sordellii]|uniref:GntR family transcriptional regulator n=1 Tax=Paeniclostridium hominis TaxID=2764329 RepID=A0ABR7K4U7_9FIRM|nr:MULTISPECIES: GntR family transcriptional regulator [Paeniclostridium]MBC6004135.1 GntR family transcriptional regulator [Paeniclostridium hominis]MDU2591269.1 GntR family transcriptional regulator [Paeniclostridium sordellii]
MLKYQQIANNIEKYIYDNDFSQGTKLPTVETLALDYNVSKSTIVKALESLVLKGIVYQVQGSGIFVRRRNRTGYIDLNVTAGFTNTLKDFKVTSKVLNFEVINPSEEIAQSLECSTEDEVYSVKRIRYIDREIMCYEESYYKKSVVPYLTKEIAEKSIFEYLEAALGLNIGFSDRYVHIDKLSDDVANILELNSGDPAMTVLEQIYLSSGLTFNFTKLTYHYKHTQFFLQSSPIK